MTRSPHFLAAALFVGAALLPASALELTTTPKGLRIDAGSLGEFELSYPVLFDATQKPVHKQIEAKAGKQGAHIRYEDGGELDVAIQAGEVTLSFLHLPSDVKAYRMTLLIDLAFSQGGRWKIGNRTEAFPRSKPPTPHLFQGSATDAQILNARGQSLTMHVPNYAFQELQDNREWNWGIFEWRFTAPFDPSHAQVRLTVSADEAAAATPAKLVDRFGQSTAEDWPGKIHSLEELKGDVEKDREYYASLHPPERDAYGGLPESGTRLGLSKSPYFHVEQKSGRWFLVDPEGNAFFHLGICSFTPGDDYTYVQGREQIYEWLPPLHSEFQSAFRPGDGATTFSFHLANAIQKFGQPYTQEEYVARMIERVRKWGFNSMGAFSGLSPRALTAARFPYVAELPLNEWEGIPRIPGVHETIDPFDEATQRGIQQNIAKGVPPLADDPLLIGWFIVNEPRYDELPKVIPSLSGDHACKRRFVDTLVKKYGTIAAFNAAWDAKAQSFDELNNSGLAVKTPTATADVTSFTGEFLEAYFSLISSVYRKYDPHHLLLGSRLQPVTIDNEQLCCIAGKYLDVMSYNYYTYGVGKGSLERIYKWTGGRPMMLSEFFWASPKDSGLVGGREVNSQTERGLAYRNYVEQSASLGFVIGIEWFTLVDEATTGRWFSKYSGESANTGLFSVADRPWKAMLEEMMKTNYGIYELLLGKKPPFSWEDSRFSGK